MINDNNEGEYSDDLRFAFRRTPQQELDAMFGPARESKGITITYDNRNVKPRPIMTTEEDISYTKSLLDIEGIERKKCECPCHNPIPSMIHFRACCDRGWIYPQGTSREIIRKFYVLDALFTLADKFNKLAEKNEALEKELKSYRDGK